MASFLQDLRIGWRVLLKEKSFFAISVFILALGICGVTTQFSVINSALIRGLPFPDAGRLVRVALRDPSWAPERTRGLFATNLLAWSGQQKSFTGLAGYFLNGSFIATIHDVPERFSGSHVTDGFFSVLGVKPALGRDFTAADQRTEAPRVTIISDAFWQSEFARDPNILGRTFRLNGRTATVIGVMPADYEFSRDQLWLPMFNEYSMASGTGGVGSVVGRLKSGVSLEQAAAEMSGFAQRAAQESPDTNRNLTEAVVEPLLNVFVGRDARELMTVMLVAVVAVLLIACINVMNMQFARATRRAKELAVRGALGASRARLVAQMLTESLIVAMLGGTLGVLLAAWAIDFYSGLVSSLPGGSALPVWLRFQIDGTVLAGTLAAVAAAVLFSGLLPALLASRTNALDVLKEGGRGHTSRFVKRATGGLVVGQIALTGALLIASLLLVKSVRSRYALDLGYDATTVLAGRMNFETDYHDDDAVRAIQARVLQRLRSVPELTAAAFTSRRNMMTNSSLSLQLEGRESEHVATASEFISDGYFATLGLQARQGREFALTDTPDSPMVVLVNATFAQKYFPRGDALGHRVREDPTEPWRTIVGVVPDTLMQGPLDPRADGAGLFIPLANYAQPYVTLVVRGHGAALALRETVRRELARVDPNLAIYQLDTPQRFLRSALAQTRTVTTLFGVFALVAVVLSVVGLYGVAAFSVSQRTSEFGIRIALGATPREIMRMVLGQGLGRFAIGALLGIGLAFALTRFGGAVLNNFLYKTSPHDPATYVLVTLLLGAATLLACLVPARRATRIDPMTALRAE